MKIRLNRTQNSPLKMTTDRRNDSAGSPGRPLQNWSTAERPRGRMSRDPLCYNYNFRLNRTVL